MLESLYNWNKFLVAERIIRYQRTNNDKVKTTRCFAEVVRFSLQQQERGPENLLLEIL